MTFIFQPKTARSYIQEYPGSSQLYNGSELILKPKKSASIHLQGVNKGLLKPSHVFYKKHIHI